MSDAIIEQLKKLRVPFPENQVSKLPKESRQQIDERKADKNKGMACKVCGNWHHKNAVHLDYVGHAALTDRLLDVDPLWTWQPVSFGPDGLPALDRNGGLWINLTICGVTRPGYGAADGKQGGDAIKELIGDALRNAAMRFGAALDLWHKGDLHVDPVLSMADKAIEDIDAMVTAEDLAAWWTDNARKFKATLEAEDWANVEKAKDAKKATFGATLRAVDQNAPEKDAA